MQISKVNTFNFFVIRYLLTVILCSLTLFQTGRIADMSVYLGWTNTPRYNPSGISTQIALNIFSKIGGWGNSYTLIILLGFTFTLIFYFLLKNLIDKKNIKLWQLILLAPGLLIYTNAPTKESLFIYPALIYLILESNYMIGKRSLDFRNFFFKFAMLLIMFLIRGDQAIPYILLTIFTFLFKFINIGKTFKKLRISLITIKVFTMSIFINLLAVYFYPQLINRLFNYLSYSLDLEGNVFRVSGFNPYEGPLSLLQSQYFSLFPSLGEFLQKPYLVLIIVDSILLIFSFFKSWGRLFNLVNPYNILKRYILIIFTYVFIVYLCIYGIVGSLNLGSSQRFRVNFIPLGILFPLILEKKLRDKETIFAQKYT